MFTHRISLMGYGVVLLSILLITNEEFMKIYSIAGALALIGFVLGICFMLLGVIARGFERVEAAILSRPL